MTRALRRFFARLLAKLRGVDVPIPTFVAGNILTAAQLNTITAALPIVDAWTSYTPTLVQSGAVTKTVVYARYIKVGRLVTVSMQLLVTGTGTGANQVVVGLPPFVPVNTGLRPGTGVLFDSSTNFVHTFLVSFNSTTSFRLLRAYIDGAAESYYGTTSFVAALAANDIIDATFTYESTT